MTDRQFLALLAAIVTAGSTTQPGAMLTAKDAVEAAEAIQAEVTRRHPRRP